MDQKENFLKVKHLFNRAGFGNSYTDLIKASKRNLNQVVNDLLKQADAAEGLKTVDGFETRQQLLKQAGLGAKKELTPAESEERKMIIRQQNEKGRDLNVEWMEKMMSSSSPFLEKMTLFWHGHFACRSNNPYYAQQLNNIQRTHALGNFKTLLMEVSQSPAMLQYLNNQQNKKNSPNENFARELMELFTLGRGNYTEQDIKAAARAFTGWSYNKEGEFEFRTQVHDAESKTFFGKTGNFDGEAIIDILLEQPATAHFICAKLYAFFVNEKPNEVHIKELAEHFYKEKYSIAAGMEKLLKARWFYETAQVGNKIKSPVEFLVTLSKTFYVNYHKPQVLIQLQSSLGQYLFNPPNVAGWPGGKSWIDSSSLMLRMRIPSLVLNDGQIDFTAKGDIEDEALIAINRKGKAKVAKSYINAEADWNRFLGALPKDCSAIDLATYLLQPALNEKNKAMVNKAASLKNVAIEITSTPEYQLC
ncbi:DUF1800 domain-containing protein [Pedobacter sp.]|uniref:DUF1800 domain-containing protein n=1 Tax=Pedobacter sp. TaxID=1411316 RepID=UPI003D7FA355